MQKGLALLSSLATHEKYARYDPEQSRRETWPEIVVRCEEMFTKRYPELRSEIHDVFQGSLLPKHVLPSMRGMQFAGKAIEINPSRIHNCSAMPVDHYKAFREHMFLLLGGTGVGYSVQRAHVRQLPAVVGPIGTQRFVVQDSIIGWADAIDRLTKAYFYAHPRPLFDFNDIRPRGTLLKTSGGRAPGPDGLVMSLEAIEKILMSVPRGTRLHPIQVHDIMLHIASAVLSGGIRRAACISLFDFDDEDMLSSKAGDWWEKNPQRAYANNSAMILRSKITRDEFAGFVKRTRDNGSGEPGFYLSNSRDALCNPCFKRDTLIPTKQGLKRIDSLVGKKPTVWDGVNWVTVDNFRVTGYNQPMLRITLHDGSELNVTPYHTMILDDGQRIEASELCVDDRLMIDTQEVCGNVTAPGAYLKGFLVGGGTTTSSNRPRAVLYVYHAGPKAVCQDRLAKSAEEITPNIDRMRIDTHTEVSWRTDTKRDVLRGLSSRHLTYWVTEAKQQFPEEVYTWDAQSRAEFVAGVMDADGTAMDSQNGFGYQITSIHKPWLQGFQLLLKTMGVQSTLRQNHKARNVALPGGVYNCQAAWRLTISQVSAIQLSQQVDFARLISFKNRKCVYNIRPRWNRVVSIEEAPFEAEVFCCTIPSTNSLSVGVGVRTGQCCEASVSLNFCNLTTVNFSSVTCQSEAKDRIRAAAFLGTLQAGFTNFHYLRDIWRERTEKEALLGVSMTGLAREDLNSFDFQELARIVLKENERVASIIGIRPAYRTTCIKPEGTTSAVLGTSSGIHAWYAQRYIRRMVCERDSTLFRYFETHYPALVEYNSAGKGLIMCPCEAPSGAVLRDQESALDLLERIKLLATDYVLPGHRKGVNTHNVSATVFVKDDEWEPIIDWMWANRDVYNGLSLFPFSDANYTQAPFEEIDQETFDKMAAHVPDNGIDLGAVGESDDTTTRVQALACAGGACEIGG